MALDGVAPNFERELHLRDMDARTVSVPSTVTRSLRPRPLKGAPARVVSRICALAQSTMRVVSSPVKDPRARCSISGFGRRLR